jgi:hypothetical protein
VSKLIRIVILAGGVFLLLQGTRLDVVTAQVMPKNPASCCSSEAIDYSYPSPCDE